MVGKCYLIRFTMQTQVVSGDESFSSSCYGKEQHLYKWKCVSFTKGNLCPAHLLSAQNNHCAKVWHFGEAEPDPLRLHKARLCCHSISCLLSRELSAGAERFLTTQGTSEVYTPNHQPQSTQDA